MRAFYLSFPLYFLLLISSIYVSVSAAAAKKNSSSTVTAATGSSTQKSAWSLCSADNTCVQVYGLDDTLTNVVFDHSPGLSRQKDERYEFLRRTLSVLVLLTTAALILLYICWETVARGRSTQEKVLQLMPKLLNQVRSQISANQAVKEQHNALITRPKSSESL